MDTREENTTKEQSIVLKFDDGDAAKGIYSIKGDSLLVLNIEDFKMVFMRLPKKPELYGVKNEKNITNHIITDCWVF